MSSDETLQKDNVTTEPEAQETASSPEQEQPTPTPPSDGQTAESQSSAPNSEAPPAEVGATAEPNAERQEEVPAEPEPSQAVSETSAVEQISEPYSPELSQEPAAEPPAHAPETPSPAPASSGEPVSAIEQTPKPPAPESSDPGSESASSEPAPAVSEPAAETPPAEPAPAESRPRPQLNPTVDPNAARPVPTLDAGSSPPPPAEEIAAKSDAPLPPPPAHVGPRSMPAEIPKTADLDADMEAQIAALQASDEASGSQPVPAPEQPAAESTDGAPAAPPKEAPPVPTSEEELEPGYRMPGKVESISGDNVFLNVGFRSPALVSLRQFDPAKPPEVGQTYQIIVDKFRPDEGLIHANLPRGKRKVQGNWDAVAVGQVVDCMVTKTNKGGLEITVSSIRGFLPASQVDMYYVPDLEKYVGEKLTVKITEANKAKRNLIVSRRAYLKEEREAQAQEIWSALEVGQAKKGVVKTLKDYGAFVDIGGVDGFLHIGEISWNRIRHPSDVLSEGQEVDVQILSLDKDRQRIGLGMRQLSQNPWDAATQKFAQGTTVSGRVTRTTDFGAFVELEPGVEGLVHISELDYRRVNKVTDVLNVGDEAELKVLDLDLGRKRISLSLKALKDKPPELDKRKPDKKSDEDLAPGGGEGYDRKRKGPLKGGTGGDAPGGLFGNPGDFSG